MPDRRGTRVAGRSGMRQGRGGIRRGPRAGVRRALDALAARGYALAYDAVVRGFGPWDAVLDEVARYTARSGTGPLRVLDVSCGVGTVARRLARDGHTVVGLDPVARLVDVARRHPPSAPGGCTFHHMEVARESPPGAGAFDVVVSVHTLHWHPEPLAVLAACRRALRPSGHAVVLAYSRPARVLATLRQLRAREGPAPALRALRWLLPTAAFDALRDVTPRYFSATTLAALLAEAGFEALEIRETFLARLSLLAWARIRGGPCDRLS